MSWQSKLVRAALGAVLTASCSLAHAETSTRSREIYAIFDFSTSASKQQVIKAALDGMKINISRSDTMTPVVMDEPPEKAARFKIVDMAEGSPLAGFLAMAPASTRMALKRATCDGAVWIADAQRVVEGIHNLRLTLCLFPRRLGYALDLYAIDTQDRGGGLGTMLGRAIANKVVGGPDAWVSKTVLDIVRSIREKTQSEVKYVDGSLEFEGEPWMQSGQLTAAQERLGGH